MKKRKILKITLALLLGGSFFGNTEVYGADYTLTQEANGGQEIHFADGDSVETTGSAALISNGGVITGNNLTITADTSTASQPPFSTYGGIVAANGGEVTITGSSSYTYRADVASNSAVAVETGGKVILDGMEANVSTTTALSPAFGVVTDSDSSLTIRNSNITTTTGKMMEVTNGGEAILEDSTFTISGRDNSSTNVFWAKGDGSEITGKNLVVINNRTDGGAYLFYASENGKITLEDSEITSTNGQALLVTSDGGTLIGRNLDLEFTKGPAYLGFAVRAHNNSEMTLIDSTLNTYGEVSGFVIITGSKLTLDHTIAQINGASQNSVDLPSSGSELVLKNGSSLTSDGVGIFAHNGTNQAVVIENSKVTSLSSYAMQLQSGSLSLDVSGSGSLMEGGVGGLRAVGSTSDTFLTAEFSQGAQLQGRVVASDLGKQASIDLDINTGAKWFGDATTSGSGTIDIALSDGGYWEGGALATGISGDISESTWKMTANSTLEILTLANQGVVAFGTDLSGGSYGNLTVGDLDGTGGQFIMRTDLIGDGNGTNAGDFLEVIGTSAGDHTVTVQNNGAANATGDERLTIIRTADGVAKFTNNNVVELGGYEYNLRDVAGTNEKEWELYATKKGPTGPTITQPGSAGVNLFAGSYLLNYAETQTLMKRMGDLRDGKESGNVWGRIYGGKFHSDTDSSLKDFDMKYVGVQVGADKKFVREDGKGVAYLGGFFGYTKGDIDYGYGSGDVDSKSIGAYWTHMHHNGFYADAVFKYGWMKNDFDVLDSQGTKVTGDDISTQGFTGSLEVGRRYHFDQKDKDGWYVEPQAQLTVSQQNGDSFRASNGLNIKVDSFRSVMGRVGTHVGYEVKGGKNPINVYGKVSVVKEFDGDVNYSLNGSKEMTSYKDTWVVYGVGATAKLGTRHNLYLDVERATGGQFTQSWAINGGYRYSW